MRTIAAAMLTMTLLVGGASSQPQNWQHEEYGNPIDGEHQAQMTLSIDPDPQSSAALVVSNNGSSRFAYILIEKTQMCTFADGDVLFAKAAFDRNVHDAMVLLKVRNDDNPFIFVHLYPYQGNWIDLIHESDNLYFRLYQDCGDHIDYEFDISGPVTIPDPSR